MSIYRGSPSKDLLYYSKAIRVVSRHTKSPSFNEDSPSIILHSALQLLGTAIQDNDVYKRYIHNPAGFVRRSIFNSQVSKEAYEHHRNRKRNTS